MDKFLIKRQKTEVCKSSQNAFKGPLPVPNNACNDSILKNVGIAGLAKINDQNVSHSTSSSSFTSSLTCDETTITSKANNSNVPFGDEKVTNSKFECKNTFGRASDVQNEIIEWPKVWDVKKWNDFKEKYPWLICKQNNLGCDSCAKVKQLGPMKEQGMYLSQEWSSCLVSECAGSTREGQLSSLRTKIKCHRDSSCHKLAEDILKKRENQGIKSKFESMTATERINTEKVFRTVYYLAKNNRPITDHEELVHLQQLNGVNLGLILHGRTSAYNIVNHIAAEIKRKIVHNLVDSKAKLAVLVDESTTISNKAVMIVNIKAAINRSDPIFMFIDLVELQSQDAVSLMSALLSCLENSGFTKEYLQYNWIAFASDGASVMLGKKSGVATRLMEQYPHLLTWHCMNHRLELAVNDAVENVTAINHFKSFIDQIYSLYSQSSKNQRELMSAAKEVESQLKRIGKILTVRWVASSFRTVKAIWDSFTALHQHFITASMDMQRDGKDRSRYKGLALRLASPQFLTDLGLMYDVLHELSNLSLELQKTNTTLPDAEATIKRTIRVLATFKEQPGEMLEIALKACKNLLFSSVPLVSNAKIQTINHNQFIQSLLDNMNERLSLSTASNCGTNSNLISCLNVLDMKKWPSAPGIRYGENEIRLLCQQFHFKSQDVDEAVMGMREFIETRVKPAALNTLFACIDTLPVSTAECERGFSQMNLICTDQRNSLLTTTISSLMMININGPPLHLFMPKQYVSSWLHSHRDADDCRSRRVEKNPPIGDSDDDNDTNGRKQLYTLLSQ